MEFDFSGKVAIVTGGSRGIGAAIAHRLASRGACVMITARKPEGLEAAAAEMAGNVAWCTANAGDPEQAAESVQRTIETFGGLDILVNNAATNPLFGRTIDAELGAFDKIVAVNLRGALAWTQEAWRQRMKDYGGSVINISSIGAFTPHGPIGVYNTTKAALGYLTAQLASELGPSVRVNAIAPGLVKTDFARGLIRDRDDDHRYPWPLRRIGQPDDIANVAMFLASDLSSWMTGQTLVVDGGALVAGGQVG